MKGPHQVTMQKITKVITACVLNFNEIIYGNTKNGDDFSKATLLPAAL